MGTRAAYSFRIGAAAAGSATSSMRMVSERRPRVRVTCPAARALRTQPTTPYGATSQRWPASWTRVTGVLRAAQSYAPAPSADRS